ncbi:alpha/beta hydrolase [Jeotgalibacillus proteolyticus]|uniref:Esterase n=1 Tax=Jeotgalibacillus proteolyticus TaxID=2082395 RepID=A0A2S5GCW3_9BACL|nr:alpha/beta hydrolase-fold protein [Jeotgalibacillus proteolyticus]PPA70877.1 esterase [Jeotgalibacillus proteolyticus]
MEALSWKKCLDATTDHTITGNVKIIDEFPMPELSVKRRIWIYLPPGYDKGNKQYPVLYMHDGQNVFDQATSTGSEWGIDETMEQLAKENSEWETIVVAIDHGGKERGNEYTVIENKKHQFLGKGKAYAAFIAQTLKPYIDQNFRTKKEREYTAIAGSSFGAYISIYCFITYPELFSRVGAFSLMCWQDKGWLAKRIREEQKTYPARIYMDLGELEADKWWHRAGLKKDVKKMKKSFLKSGYKESEVKFDLIKEGKHHETTWRKTFPTAFKWWSRPL